MEELKEFSQMSVSEDKKSHSKEEKGEIHLIPSMKKLIQELILIQTLKMARNPETQAQMR